VVVEKLAEGLWRWTARHPAWTPEQGGPEGWGPEVASYYCEAEGEILLADPIVPAEPAGQERFWTALDRDVARAGAPDVLLTCAWHARSSADVLARYPRARVWAPAESAGELPRALRRVARRFLPGESLPGAASALEAAVGEGEVLLWLPSHRALVSGDVLLGEGEAGLRLCPDSWLGDDPAGVRGRLRRALAGLPVEWVLLTHGEAVSVDAQAALAAVLQEP
jgi:hypothetical protein